MMIKRIFCLTMLLIAGACASPANNHENWPLDGVLADLDVKAKPPEPGSELLHVFLSGDIAAVGSKSEFGVAIVVGQREVVSQGSTPLADVLATQQKRLREFATKIEEGVAKAAVRKSMQGWAMCICSASTKCQGGTGPCGGCSTCKFMSEGHGAAKQGFETWPKARSQMGSRMGLESSDCPPKNIVLLIDTSGSMEEENKLEELKKVLKESLRHYMGGDVFTLVSFSVTPNLVIPPTILKVALDLENESQMPIMMSSQLPVKQIIGRKPKAHMDRTVNKFVTAIDSLWPEGQTDIRTALIVASNFARKTKRQRDLLSNPNAINRILLFSDGLHFDEQTSSQEREDFKSLVRDITRDGLSVSTFGIGDRFDKKLMTAIVDPELGHKGHFHYVKEMESIRQLLWDEMMIMKAARKTRISVVLPEDIKVQSVGNGGLRFGSKPGQLYAKLKTFDLKDKRTLSFNLKLNKEVSDLGRVRLDYIDDDGVARFEERPIQIASNATVEHSSSQERLIALEEIILQKSRTSLRQAVKLVDLGNLDYAVQFLRDEAEKLADLNRGS